MTMPTFTDAVLVHAVSLTALSTGVNSLNSLLTGAVAPRAYVPAVAARITSNKSISNNSDTVVTFDAAAVNNDAMWASATNHLTIKTAGVYVVWGQCHFAAAAGGVRSCHIMLNGTSPTTNPVAAAARNAYNFGDGSFFCAVTPPLSLAVNAQLFFSVFQNSGGALNLDITDSGAFMGAFRVGS
jgi:hypothetical protein